MAHPLMLSRRFTDDQPALFFTLHLRVVLRPRRYTRVTHNKRIQTKSGLLGIGQGSTRKDAYTLFTGIYFSSIFIDTEVGEPSDPEDHTIR